MTENVRKYLSNHYWQQAFSFELPPLRQKSLMTENRTENVFNIIYHIPISFFENLRNISELRYILYITCKIFKL